MSSPETLPTQSTDLTAELLAALREQVPQVFAESGVDVEKLRAALGDHVVAGKERYGLTWVGKSDAFRHVQTPSIGTLAPMPSDSVNWDSTENMIIEGDNLEVLKLLQRPYHGKVKMIYIDPPYNTGNEFIYPDNFREGLQDYLRYSGQVSEEGFAQTTNKDTSGRYHSNWLSMMYPRLFLARNLLREDGVIFVSIDDHEVHNLRHLMDEIFGEENFVATLIWKSRQIVDSRSESGASSDHEYVLAYGRANEGALLGQKIREDKYKNPDNDPRGPWMSNNMLGLATKAQRPNLHYTLTDPATGKEFACPESSGWRYSRATMEQKIQEGRILFPKGESGRPREKLFMNELTRFRTGFSSILPADAGFTLNGTREVRDQLGENIFSFPKPTSLVQQLVAQGTSEAAERGQDIILDFFAGSGTTAQAVLDLNEKDGGNRKFILVQLPEKTDNPKFPTIAEITRERVRRVIKKLDEKKVEESKAPKQCTLPQLNGASEEIADRGSLDLGFRAFRLTQSNFRVWDASAATDEATLKEQIALHADHVNGEASSMALLFEIILRAGLPPSSPIRRIEVPREGAASLVAHSVNDDELLVCVEQKLMLADMRALIAIVPKKGRVVCLDRAFEGNDSIKTNAVNEARTHDVTFYTV